jgi:hypothetical protein
VAATTFESQLDDLRFTACYRSRGDGSPSQDGHCEAAIEAQPSSRPKAGFPEPYPIAPGGWGSSGLSAPGTSEGRVDEDTRERRDGVSVFERGLTPLAELLLGC